MDKKKKQRMDETETKNQPFNSAENEHCDCGCEHDGCDCGEHCNCEHDGCKCGEHCECQHETVEVNKEAVY